MIPVPDSAFDESHPRSTSNSTSAGGDSEGIVGGPGEVFGGEAEARSAINLSSVEPEWSEASESGADPEPPGMTSEGPVHAGGPDAPLPDVGVWVAVYWDSVYKLLYRLTGNRHDAEDLTQETFLRAIERQDSFKLGTNLRAWLLRIATNAFLDRQRRRKVLNITSLPDEISQDAPGPGQGLEDVERHAKVEAAIAQLPETQRVIFLLRGQNELSFREIGQAIGMTEETARWHMMQARRHLLAKLNGIL